MRRQLRTTLLAIALIVVIAAIVVILLGMRKSRVIPHGMATRRQVENAVREIREELDRIGRSQDEIEAAVRKLRCDYLKEGCGDGSESR